MTTVPPGESTRELINRIRTVLPDEQLREVRMFGVTAIMVDNAMAVAVHPDGGLLVRVDPAEDAALLENPQVSRAEMGSGRSMGEGWIRVDAKALRTDAALSKWLQAATRYLDRRFADRGRGPVHAPISPSAAQR
jgi:TfoX/Sxy family transcriptional regulator of competence genes